MSELYPYVDTDRLESTNTYAYSPLHGKAFIDEYFRLRDEIRMTLPDPITNAPKPVKPSRVIDDDSNIYTKELLEDIYIRLIEHNILPKELLLLVKRFEVTKKLFPIYDTNYRATDKTTYREYSLYIRFMEILAYAYQTYSRLDLLNCYLKCIDTLVSVHELLDDSFKKRLSRLLSLEKSFVTKLMYPGSNNAYL